MMKRKGDQPKNQNKNSCSQKLSKEKGVENKTINKFINNNFASPSNRMIDNIN